MGRIERLAEVEEARTGVGLFLEHEKSTAKALEKIPGPIRGIVTAVRADKVSARALVLKRGTLEGTDDETSRRVAVLVLFFRRRTVATLAETLRVAKNFGDVVEEPAGSSGRPVQRDHR
ncbi:unnamed protein product [Amoebophrya sp. A25]|nr:unnamed protein product [Amoebophrya sp. A25]|eukprot:GSA25T00010832001.1